MKNNKIKMGTSTHLSKWSLGGRFLALFLALAMVGLPVGIFAFCYSGTFGLAAAVVALVICLFGGGSSLLVNDQFRSPELVLYQVLFGMVIRTGIPLGICLFIYANGGPLVEFGMVYYLLVFYFVTLFVETFFLVDLSNSEPESTKA